MQMGDLNFSSIYIYIYEKSKHANSKGDRTDTEEREEKQEKEKNLFNLIFLIGDGRFPKYFVRII